MHSTQLYFSLPWGQGLHTAHLLFTLPLGQGVQSAQLRFSLPCWQGLHSLQPCFGLPLGQGLHFAQWNFLPWGHRFCPAITKVRLPGQTTSARTTSALRAPRLVLAKREKSKS